MYAGSLLHGQAQQWMQTLIDLVTINLPLHYIFDNFLGELTTFFGGGGHLGLPGELLGRSASHRFGVRLRHCIPDHHQHLRA